MQILTKGTEAEDFYRERYGIDISDFDQIIRSSLENLYYRDIRLSPGKLYSKLEQCGIYLHPGALSRVRKDALTRRVPAEPPMLTRYGARLWHLLQAAPFDGRDIAFLEQNFPGVAAGLYPSLTDGQRNIYSRSTANARKAAVMRQPLSEDPQTR